MIKTFKSAGTEDIFDGMASCSARSCCPQSIWPVARRKLDQINRVREINELECAFLVIAWERLKGDRKNQYSIRINQQYRICFTWEEGHAYEIEITGLPLMLVGDCLEIAPPTHPGEMLFEEFVKPLDLTQAELARRLDVSYPRLNEIIKGRRSVTPDTALRLSRVLGMPADFWLGLQQDWDLWHAMNSPEAKKIDRLKPIPTDQHPFA